MTASASSDRFPQLDKYKLLEEIGHGGMATVYRARDERLGRDVAVKVIHKHLRQNAEVRRRFVSEARAVAKLRHPGIVEVYDVADDDDEERYLVVELIDGSTLRQVLEDCGPLPAEIAAAMVAQLCDAVAHAHRCGVVHRDIKPENVLIEWPTAGPTRSHSGDSDGAAPSSGRRISPGWSDRGRVIIKLTDFGIAKVLDAQGVTSTGQILGSPAHMAPEQIEGGEVGRYTDVFALGVLLYECMVGHLPFEGKNPAQVLRRVLEGDFDPADEELPSVGGRWARIVAATLQVDVAQRTATAEALQEAIAQELEALGIEQPAHEIAQFFADPEGYRAALLDRLVPRLVERGERARKRRMVQDAAADFNRALALRPDDLSILRKVSSLSSRTAWRRRLGRAGAIVAGSAALGLVAFAATRWWVANRLQQVATLEAPPLLVVSTAPLPRASGRAAGVPTAAPRASAKAQVKRIPRLNFGALRLPPRPKRRRVRIGLHPAGAEVRIDGQVTSVFGATLLLTPGPHRLEAAVPASSCCRQLATSFVVTAAPEDAPEEVQQLSFSVPIRPARVSLRGAPTGGTMSCRNGVTVASGSSASVPMKNLDWTGSCTLSPGGRHTTVHLVAGKMVTVDWR